MILTVTPNPCVDKTVTISALKVGTFMRASGCSCIAGGKGCNVSRAVKVLGRPTKALTVVGGHPGAHVIDMLTHQDGIECVPVWVASQTRTITTVLEEPVHRQTAFFEPGSSITEVEAIQIVSSFRETVVGAGVVTFNGTVSDPSLKPLYRELIPIARAAGAVTILDAHGPEFALGLEARPYMVKPNVAEAQELFGFSIATEDDQRRTVDIFHEMGVGLVTLTLGRDGALISDGETRLRVIPPTIDEINPVGSGDAFVAGFAIGLMEGMPLEDMTRLAVAAGAANATNWDIGHFTPQQVEDLMQHVQIFQME